MQTDRVSAAPFDEQMLFGDSPRQMLAFFLDSVFDLIRIGERSSYVLFSLRTRAAWRRAVLELNEERLLQLRAVVLGETSTGRDIPAFVSLEEAGLVGAQLSAKLTAYAEAREAFHQRGGVANFWRSLRWAKAILSSLTKVLPFAEFLLELIDFLENGAEDIRDLEKGVL